MTTVFVIGGLLVVAFVGYRIYRKMKGDPFLGSGSGSGGNQPKDPTPRQPK